MMGRPTDEELKIAKKLWREGKNDVQVGEIMGWSISHCSIVRTYCLGLPANRTWSPEKKKN
jgi:hypothetical protein